VLKTKLTNTPVNPPNATEQNEQKAQKRTSQMFYKTTREGRPEGAVVYT